MISKQIALALVASLAFAGSAIAGPDTSGAVDCVQGSAKEVVNRLEGRPSMPYACELSNGYAPLVPLSSEGPADGVIDCVKGGLGALAQALLEGVYEPYACNLNADGTLDTAAADGGIVDCVTGTASAIVRAVEGYPQPYHCDLSGDDPVAGAVDCVTGGAEQLARALLGEPYMPYPCEL